MVTSNVDSPNQKSKDNNDSKNGEPFISPALRVRRLVALTSTIMALIVSAYIFSRNILHPPIVAAILASDENVALTTSSIDHGGSNLDSVTVAGVTVTQEDFISDSGDTFQFINPRVENFTGRNSTCILIGCHSSETTYAQYFRDWYGNCGYDVVITVFDDIRLRDNSSQAVAPHWCSLPASLQALRANPNSRVIYADLDTRIDIATWCDMPHIGVNSPIVMNSLYRQKSRKTQKFTVQGTMVQSNTYVVASGLVGIAALRRWEQGFDDYWPFFDQGAIHVAEKGLCGVPGWVSCYSNHLYQRCHCTGLPDKDAKIDCVRRLFSDSDDHPCKLGCLPRKF